jgi:sulfofructose kinase
MADIQVVGLGLCVYDLSLLVDGFPEADTKVDAIGTWHGGGGPVPNTLVALANWGVSCAYVGSAGRDLWGHALRDAFVAAGVDVSAMTLSESRRTPIASLHVDAPTGRRTAVLGGHPRSEPESIPPGLIEQAAVVHFDARHPGSCLEAARRAHKSRVAVSLDVGSPRREGLELLDLAHHLVVAERFAKFASGRTSVSDMLHQLWSVKREAVVITRGESGSVARDKDHGQIECGCFAVEVVDTTGAGDLYHAGYLLGLIEGWSLPKRMEFASAAAALACTGLGARGCLPSRSEVESLLKTSRTVSC